MILGVLIAAGVLAYQTGAPVQAVPPSQAPEADVLKARLQSEVPDTSWAPRAGESLRAAYRDIHVDLETLTCGSSLCEVVGSMSRSMVEQPLIIPSMAERLGSADGEGASALMLVRSDTEMVRSNAEPISEEDRFTMTAYWRRVD